MIKHVEYYIKYHVGVVKPVISIYLYKYHTHIVSGYA